MSINSAVLEEENREPLPINSLERTKLVVENVKVTLLAGSGYPGASDSFCGVGRLVCTNYRIVFVTIPALVNFDSFMVTWNKIEAGGLVRKPWFVPFGTPSGLLYRTMVHPIDESSSLRCTARIEILFNAKEEAKLFDECLKDSRWMGHLDPENTCEPPPRYPRTPPPKYDDFFSTVNEEGEDRNGNRRREDDRTVASPNLTDRDRPIS